MSHLWSYFLDSMHFRVYLNPAKLRLKFQGGRVFSCFKERREKEKSLLRTSTKGAESEWRENPFSLSLCKTLDISRI